MSILFNGNKFDLELTWVGDEGVDELRSASFSAPPASDVKAFNYILQSHQPLSDSQTDEIMSLGVEFKEYMDGNAWLCRVEPDNLASVQRLDCVRMVLAFPPKHKIPPNLQSLSLAGEEEETCTIDIGLHKPVSQTTTAQKISETFDIPAADMSMRRGERTIRVKNVHPSKLLGIAGLDNVKVIQEVVDLRLYNDVARGIISADVGDTIIPDTELTGAGQIITVADTGFDNGDVKNPHSAFAGRVERLIPIGRHKTGETNDQNGHGTHVCGSVLGSGTSEVMGGLIQGTAPGARLVVQALLGPSENGRHEVLFGTSDKGMKDLLSEAYELGSRVHTNSWATGWDSQRGQSQYIDESGDIDSFVWQHRDMVVLFAAGNDGQEQISVGNGRGHIGAQSASKNCITVGSCDNRRPASDATYKRYDQKGTRMGNPNHVSVFSSRGPTREGRIKPDVIAPGAMILSAASRAVDKKKSKDKANSFGECPDEQWAFFSGTSMATPLVAGCVAVLREAFFQRGDHSQEAPSAALIKAMIVNGATDLGRPSAEQGFGRVNLANSISIIQGSRFWEGQIERSPPADATAREIKLSDFVTDATGTVTLKTTMVFMDLQGASLQMHLKFIAQRATVDGQTLSRHGNASPADAPKHQDSANTVRQIVWRGLPVDAAVALKVERDHAGIMHPNAKVVPFAVVWAVTAD